MDNRVLWQTLGRALIFIIIITLIITLKISVIRILVNFKGIIFSLVFVIIVLSLAQSVPEDPIIHYLHSQFSEQQRKWRGGGGGGGGGVSI